VAATSGWIQPHVAARSSHMWPASLTGSRPHVADKPGWIRPYVGDEAGWIQPWSGWIQPSSENDGGWFQPSSGTMAAGSKHDLAKQVNTCLTIWILLNYVNPWLEQLSFLVIV